MLSWQSHNFVLIRHHLHEWLKNEQRLICALWHNVKVMYDHHNWKLLLKSDTIEVPGDTYFEEKIEYLMSLKCLVVQWDTISFHEMNSHIHMSIHWQIHIHSHTCKHQYMIVEEKTYYFIWSWILRHTSFSYERELWIDVEKFQSHQGSYNHQLYFDDHSSYDILTL